MKPGCLVCVLFVCAAVSAGAQFREIPLPFPDTTRFRLQFIDELHGWVAGYTGSILHTSDGGTSWNEYRSPYPTHAISEIRFKTKDYGILWANPDPNSYTGRLYQTFNAGKDWQEVKTYDSILISSPTPTNQFDYKNIYPINPGHMVFSGGREWRYGQGVMHGEHFIAWTTNGGRDWSKTVMPLGSPTVFIPMDTNRWGWLVGTAEIPGVTPWAAFGISTDRGVNWTLARYWTPFVPSGCEFWDSKRGIVFGDIWEERHIDSGSYVTYDGGETWEEWPMVRGFTAVLIKDSVLYCLSPTDTHHTWDRRLHGYVRRYHRAFPWHAPIVLLRENATSISSAGTKVYVLLLDGRLLMLDHATPVENPPTAPETVGFSVSPNPARSEITISRTGVSGTFRTFDVYNATGKRVLEGVDLVLQPWEERKTISVDMLPTGVYRIVQRGGNAQVRSVTIVK